MWFPPSAGMCSVLLGKREPLGISFHSCKCKGAIMRRVLACVAMTALAFLTVQPAAALARSDPDPDIGPAQFDRVVISEVSTGGPFNPNDEWVELLNVSRTQIADIGNWSLRLSTCDGQRLGIHFLFEGAVLQQLDPDTFEQAFWLIASPDYMGRVPDQVTRLNMPDRVVVELFNAFGKKMDSVNLCVDP
jgi:hypothetical protein